MKKRLAKLLVTTAVLGAATLSPLAAVPASAEAPAVVAGTYRIADLAPGTTADLTVRSEALDGARDVVRAKVVRT